MTQDLAALVGSRICHDLISPIGAIGNGVELMSLTGRDMGDEMALITQSVENANARIRYFRMAFGNAGPDQSAAETEIRSILKALSGGSRIRYDWRAQGDPPRRDVRAIFLALQCMETAMPLGGTLVIDRQGPKWTLTGLSDRLSVNAKLWDSIEQGADAATPSAASEVQFALLPAALADARRKLAVEFGTDRILLKL